MSAPSVRVVLVPVNGAPTIEHVPTDELQGRRAMEKLIDSTMFSVVTVAVDPGSGESLQILVDDDGIRRGKVAHFWARGAVLYGPLLITRSNRDGANVDFEDLELEALMVQASGLGATWDEALFAPIPPDEIDEAFAATERLHEEGLMRLRQQMEALHGKGNFFIHDGGPAPRPKKDGAA